MKILINSLLLILFSSLFVKIALAQKAINNKEVEVIKKLEYNWLVAEFKRDTAKIASLMEDSFLSISKAGVSNKKEELADVYEDITQRMKGDHVIDSLYLDEIKVTFYNNTAVATFVAVTKGRIKNVPFENRRTRIYDVWIKRKGQWKAVSSQTTRLN